MLEICWKHAIGLLVVAVVLVVIVAVVLVVIVAVAGGGLPWWQFALPRASLQQQPVVVVLVDLPRPRPRASVRRLPVLVPDRFHRATRSNLFHRFPILTVSTSCANRPNRFQRSPIPTAPTHRATQ